MKELNTKKSAFSISMYYRRVKPKKNPKPNSPKYSLKTHQVPILILNSVQEVVEFLDRYTDFDKFYNSDILQKKEALKDSFCIDISNYDRLKKEVLWDKQGFRGENFFDEYYNEHLLDIKRLPIGIVKRHLWEDLV